MCWTVDRVAELKAGVAEGLSAAAIANKLGASPLCGCKQLSRNAVHGKAHRLGLSMGGAVGQSSINKRSTQEKTRSRNQAMVVKANKKRGFVYDGAHAGYNARRETIALANADSAPPEARMLKLLDLEPGDCRWPIGDPRAKQFGFCGCPKASSGPYCPHHASMAYNSVPKRTGALFVLPRLPFRPERPDESLADLPSKVA